MVAALVATLDNHFPGFLDDFCTNADRAFNHITSREDIRTGESAVATAQQLVRLINEDRGRERRSS